MKKIVLLKYFVNNHHIFICFVTTYLFRSTQDDKSVNSQSSVKSYWFSIILLNSFCFDSNQ